MAQPLKHPADCSRRTAVQAGTIGLLGLGMNHLDWLRAEGVAGRGRERAKSVIYIFLSGGLAQHESFDMKPDAPSGIRGEFKPIRHASRRRTTCPPRSSCRRRLCIAQAV